MTRREPSDEAILAARLQRAYPSLSPYSSASLAQQLCAIERMQRLHATRWCNDADYQLLMPRFLRGEKRIVSALTRWKTEVAHRCLPDGVGAPDGDPRHERMIRLASDLSTNIELHGDPRGAVLKVRLPGEAEAVSV